MAVMRKAYADRVSNLRDQMNAMKAGRFESILPQSPNRSTLDGASSKIKEDTTAPETSCESSALEKLFKTQGTGQSKLRPDVAMKCAEALAATSDKVWNPEHAATAFGLKDPKVRDCLHLDS